MKPKPTHRDLIVLYFAGAAGLLAIAITTLLSGCATANTRLTRADLTPAQLAQPAVQETMAAADEADRANAHFMYGCQGADVATTGIGLAVGLAEANPLGLLTIPIAFIVEKIVQHNAEQSGDHRGEKVVGAVHCGAAVLNIATIL